MKAARLTCGEEAGSKSGRDRRETGQRDRSGRRNWRQVRETGLGEGTGDRSERQVWEKELETGQRDRSGRRNWRQVRVPAALQHNSGDRVYFNTTAVTECTSTQQR